MNHTHEYSFWHAHEHLHDGAAHATGHYHNWAQTHDHGAKSNLAPHTHQARQAHPGEEYRHHHAVEDHEKEDTACAG